MLSNRSEQSAPQSSRDGSPARRSPKGKGDHERPQKYGSFGQAPQPRSHGTRVGVPALAGPGTAGLRTRRVSGPPEGGTPTGRPTDLTPFAIASLSFHPAHLGLPRPGKSALALRNNTRQASPRCPSWRVTCFRKARIRSLPCDASGFRPTGGHSGFAIFTKKGRGFRSRPALAVDPRRKGASKPSRACLVAQDARKFVVRSPSRSGDESAGLPFRLRRDADPLSFSPSATA